MHAQMTTHLLNFIICIIFSTSNSLKSEDINFQFISATSKFQYAIPHPDYYKFAVQMVDLSDTLLMVAVEQNLYMGPAQLKYRVVESPFEQVVKVKYFKYSPIKKNIVQTTFIEDEGELMYSSPNYGFLTLTNNFLFKKLLYAEHFFDTNEYREARIVKNFTVSINDLLVAVTLFKGKLETRMVKVLPFSRCENVFDPERRFIVDQDEQICTESVENRKSKPPQTIPSSLLFGKTEEHGLVFVGITSRTRAGVSLSTFLPFHCDFIAYAYKKELCI